MKTESKYIDYNQKASFLLRFLQFRTAIVGGKNIWELVHKDFWTPTTSMARKRHLHQTEGVDLCFCLESLVSRKSFRPSAKHEFAANYFVNYIYNALKIKDAERRKAKIKSSQRKT